jgi:plasmid stabilization system protein ParE
MKIIWTNPALKGVNKAIDFTEINLPNNKNKLIKLLKNTHEQLLKFPFSGNLIDPEKTIFRIVFTSMPFCLAYKVKDDNLYILSFVHQHQNLG